MVDTGRRADQKPDALPEAVTTAEKPVPPPPAAADPAKAPDADEKYKADGALKREFMVARRNLHGFWVGFRKWQIRQAKESIRRWVTDLRKHGQIMRTLAKQILK
jgi:hypothetical protein